MPHHHTVRVYYEDTDLGGIVYYANYLKYIERGRSEWLRDLGIDQNALKADHGLVFAVRRVVADYLAPARFDDVLDVQTTLARQSGARIDLHQRVLRADTPLFEADVTLACISLDGRPRPLPKALSAQLAALAG